MGPLLHLKKLPRGQNIRSPKNLPQFLQCPCHSNVPCHVSNSKQSPVGRIECCSAQEVSGTSPHCLQFLTMGESAQGTAGSGTSNQEIAPEQIAQMLIRLRRAASLVMLRCAVIFSTIFHMSLMACICGPLHFPQPSLSSLEPPSHRLFIGGLILYPMEFLDITGIVGQLFLIPD